MFRILVKLLESISEQGYMSCALSLAMIVELIDSAQKISIREEFTSFGLFSWLIRQKSEERSWLRRRPLAITCAMMFSYRGYMFVTFVQVICAFVVFSHALITHRNLIIFILLVLRIASQLRNDEFGIDGSSNIQILSLSGLFVYFSGISRLAAKSAIVFVTVQIVTMYISSGVAKVQFASWRDGSALVKTLSTRLFGHKALSNYLEKHETLRKSISWYVLVFECIFPLFVFINPVYCFAFLLLGTIFHLLAAEIMGLNIFAISILATYPIIMCFSLKLQINVGDLIEMILKKIL